MPKTKRRRIALNRLWVIQGLSLDDDQWFDVYEGLDKKAILETMQGLGELAGGQFRLIEQITTRYVHSIVVPTPEKDGPFVTGEDVPPDMQDSA